LNHVDILLKLKKILSTDSDQNIQILTSFLKQLHLDVVWLIKTNQTKKFESYQKISKRKSKSFRP
jgi:hypothetical protein